VFVSARYFVTDRGWAMDEVDLANDQVQADINATLRAARKDMKKGRPGDCDLCGEWSGRFIEGCCAPCRDRYKLK